MRMVQGCAHDAGTMYSAACHKASTQMEFWEEGAGFGYDSR